MWVAAVWAAEPALARRAGAPALRNGSIASAGQNCSACHLGSLGFPNGSVEILNGPAAYNLNRVYDLSVRVRDADQVAPNAGGGFEFSAESGTGAAIGTLLLSDAVNTRFTAFNTSFVTHTSTGVTNSTVNWAANGNSVTYSLQWKAPAADMGVVTFYAAGNAVDNNTFNSGDHVYLANASAGAVTCQPGDVNQSGTVDADDISAFVTVWLDVALASEVQFCTADLNTDGLINEADVQLFADLLVAD
jgi:hypothetical protein